MTRAVTPVVKIVLLVNREALCMPLRPTSRHSLAVDYIVCLDRTRLLLHTYILTDV